MKGIRLYSGIVYRTEDTPPVSRGLPCLFVDVRSSLLLFVKSLLYNGF